MQGARQNMRPLPFEEVASLAETIYVGYYHTAVLVAATD